MTSSLNDERVVKTCCNISKRYWKLHIASSGLVVDMLILKKKTNCKNQVIRHLWHPSLTLSVAAYANMRPRRKRRFLFLLQTMDSMNLVVSLPNVNICKYSTCKFLSIHTYIAFITYLQGRYIHGCVQNNNYKSMKISAKNNTQSHIIST